MMNPFQKSFENLKGDNEVTAEGFDDGEENISVVVPSFCAK